MPEPVESVIVELIAQSGNFDAKVKQSAAAFGDAMKSVEDSATHAETLTRTKYQAIEASLKRLGKPFDEAAINAAAASGQWIKASESMNRLKTSSDALATSGNVVVKSAGSQRTGMQQLSYQIADVATGFASGQKPMMIFAQQGTQIVQALGLMTTGTSGLLGFLGGPWGLVLTSAATVAISLGLALRNAAGSIDSMVTSLQEAEHKTELSDLAQQKFGITLEGVTKALRENRKAIDDLAGAQDTGAEAALNNARKQAGVLAVLLQQKLVQLQIAKANEELLQNPSVQAGGFANPQAVSTAQTIATSRREAIDKAIADTKAQIAEANKQIVQATSEVTVEQATSTAEDRIKRTYDRAIEAARQRAVAEHKVGDELERQIKLIVAARDAELKALADSERESRKAKDTNEITPFINPVGSGPITGRFGEQRPGHTHAGIDIAVPVGTPVKAAAGGTVIEAGTLAGYGNVIIIDHGGGTITRYAHLSRISASKGQQVEQGDIIALSGGMKGAPGAGNSQGPHLHYEVRQGGRAVDPRKAGYVTDPVDSALKAEQQAKRAVEAAQKEEARQQAFENERAGLQGDEIKAREQLVKAADELAQLELMAIEVARKKYNDNVESQIKQGKLTKDEAAELVALNDERAKLRAELVKRREDERKFRVQESDAQRQLQYDEASMAAQGDLLQSQEGIARTVKQRHSLEQRLIDLGFDEEKLQLQAIIAKGDRLKIELDRIKTLRALSDAEKAELDQATKDSAVAQDRLATLPERQANAQKGNDRQNMTALQQFKDIPKTADEIDQALNDIAAGGLHAVVDGLTDAIVNFKSLGDVGRAVLQEITAALVRMVIQMLIVKALGFLGLAGGGPVGGSSGGGGGTSGGQVFAAGGPVGFPGGGPIIGPGGPTDDKVLIRASNDEYVIRADSAKKLGRHALDHMNLTGELPYGFAMGGGIGGGAMRLPGPGSSQSAGIASLDEASVAQLGRIVADAARAQPDIKLYPTMSPAAAMRAQLASPGGRKAMFDFIGENPGAFKSAAR